MAEPLVESRIVIPISPSLSHSALLKVAVSLLNNFSCITSKTAYAEIQNGNSGSSQKGSEEVFDVFCNRIDDNLLFMPGRLRRRVLAAVHGLYYAVEKWKEDHADFLRYKDGEHFFHWREDGTIDSVKTAKHLVMDESISIRERFDLACMYALEESIRTLWTEMQSSGESENFSSRVRFWVRWLREGSLVPWTQVVREYLDQPPILELRFSCLLPFLQPGERRQLLFFLRFAKLDDFRHCLYSITTEEEVEILEMYASRVLRLHLNWPLQSLFLERAEKMMNYIDAEDFNYLLSTILYLKESAKDFDYCKLFEAFWSMSPIYLKESVKRCPYLKESVKRCPYLRENLDAYFNENRKRKSDEKERTNSKKEKCK